MAKVYDLSKYLEEEKSKIKFGEEEFEINDGFNDLLKIDALSERRDEIGNAEFIKEFLCITLGTETANELMSRNYKAKVYSKIMESIQAAMSDDDEEGVSQE